MTGLIMNRYGLFTMAWELSYVTRMEKKVSQYCGTRFRPTQFLTLPLAIDTSVQALIGDLSSVLKSISALLLGLRSYLDASIVVSLLNQAFYSPIQILNCRSLTLSFALPVLVESP